MSDVANLSADLQNRYSDKTMNASGYADGIVIFPSNWLLANGGPLAQGSGNIQYKTNATNLIGIAFTAAAGTSDSIQLAWQLPSHWAEFDDRVGKRGKIMLRLKVRNVGSGGTANDDILLQTQVYIHNSSFSTAKPPVESAGDTSLTSGSAVVTALVPARAADSAEESFRVLEFDLTSKLTAAQCEALKPGSTFQINVSVDQTVSANNEVHICGAELCYMRHPTIANQYRRSQMLG